MTSCRELEKNLSVRPLGVLDPVQEQSVARHLEQCDECRALASDLEQALAGAPLKVDSAARERAWEKLEARLRVASAPVRVALNCTFCHDHVESARAAYCARCLAPHHDDCFAAHGECSAPGCGETRSVRSRVGGSRWPRRLAAAALVLVIGGGAAAFALRRTPTPVERELIALGLDPTKAESWVARARALEQAKRFDDALEAYTRAFALDPKCVPALEARARIFEGEGRVQDALDEISRAIGVLPRDGNLYFARARLRARGCLPEALADCTTAIELDPRSSAAWALRGEARLSLGDDDGAIADLTRAIELDPRLAAAWCNRARARTVKGDLQGTMQDATRAIELDPRDSAAWAERGAVRARLGDIEGAVADASKALELDPKLTRGWLTRAQVREEKGDFEGALGDATRAIELEPAAPRAWVLRGTARTQRGDLDGAIDDLERALKLSPETEKPQIEEVLAKLRPSPTRRRLAR